jgi:hypothetical protein
MPAAARLFIATSSLSENSAFLPGNGFMLRSTETTQSLQAMLRIMQLSQFIIMLKG